MKIFKYVGFMMLVLLVSVSSADEGPKIMVLNSNASIDKYRIASKGVCQIAAESSHGSGFGWEKSETS